MGIDNRVARWLGRGFYAVIVALVPLYVVHNQNTPSDDSFDELGLTSPEVARHIIEGDLDYPFVRWQPKYVIVSWPGRYSPHERAWFAGAYAKVGEFHHPYWAEHLNRGAYLYVRTADASVLRPAAGGRRPHDEARPAPR